MHGLRLQQVGPAHQRGVVRYGVQPHSAELAQHQAVADEVLGLGVAPVVQMLNNQQPQDHLDWCGWSAGLSRTRPSSAQISFDLLEDLVVFEQPIQFSQLRFKPQFERGYQLEQVDWRGPIS